MGGDFDGGCEDAGEVDEEAGCARSADGEEGAGVALERSADYTYLPPYHGGGELGGEVVFGVGGEVDGGDEGVHVVGTHNDGGCLCAFCVAVLQGRCCGYDGVKGCPGGVDEEEVGYCGDLTALFCASAGGRYPFEWGEYVEAEGGEVLIVMDFGVLALEVSHGVPLWCVCGYRAIFRVLLGGGLW